MCVSSWPISGAPYHSAEPRDGRSSQHAARCPTCYAAITTSIGTPNSTGQRCAYRAPATMVRGRSPSGPPSSRLGQIQLIRNRTAPSTVAHFTMFDSTTQRQIRPRNSSAPSDALPRQSGANASLQRRTASLRRATRGAPPALASSMHAAVRPHGASTHPQSPCSSPSSLARAISPSFSRSLGLPAACLRFRRSSRLTTCAVVPSGNTASMRRRQASPKSSGSWTKSATSVPGCFGLQSEETVSPLSSTQARREDPTDVGQKAELSHNVFSPLAS